MSAKSGRLPKKDPAPGYCDELAIREAFDCARANQHNDAVTILDKAIDATSETQVKAWLLSRKAAFQHAIDAEGAQKTLLAAHSMEPGVIKPMHGASYKKLTPATGRKRDLAPYAARLNG